MGFVFNALRGSIVFGLRLVRGAVDSVLGGQEQRTAPPPQSTQPRPAAPLRPAKPLRPAPEPRAQRSPQPVREAVVERPVAAVPDPEPAHVSEEPQLVAQVAEQGAADGPGPEIRVAEPWGGYGRLNAKAVIDRVSSATDAELAAIQLFEGSHRSRRTVLAAAEKELRRRTAGR